MSVMKGVAIALKQTLLWIERGKAIVTAYRGNWVTIVGAEWTMKSLTG